MAGIYKKFTIAAAGIALSWTAINTAPAAATSLYSVTDLGKLPGSDFGIAADVNDIGQVVGWSSFYETPSTPFHSRAFFWENGVMTDLGTLGGTNSQATAINNLGQVVGSATLERAYYKTLEVFRPFLWSEESGMIDLTAQFDPSLTFASAAYSINNIGQVTIVTTNHTSYLWENGVFTDLCVNPSGYCEAYDINDKSQAVGSMEVEIGSIGNTIRHAFLWENGLIIDLGTFEEIDNFSIAHAINEVGQIVGEADFKIALWENGELSILGRFGGYFANASDINDFGQVVGRSDISYETNEGHAFLWDRTSGLQDLNNLIPANSGWLLEVATAINNKGEIVGYGFINGQENAFLLTPITQSVPEPVSALSLLAFGTYGIGLALCKKLTSS
jgi:probable HAF family extracellular repeat protein